MKKRILFVHSAGNQGPHEGSNGLIANLKKAFHPYYEVEAPLMPEPDNPRYESWKKATASLLNNGEGELVLIGHSLGGSILLKYLSENTFNTPIAALFLISTPFWGKGDWAIDEYELRPDFAEKLPPIGQFFLYHSKKDQWVPFSHLDLYSKKLPKATVRVIEGDQHEFFDGLPVLTEDLKTILTKK